MSKQKSGDLSFTIHPLIALHADTIAEVADSGLPIFAGGTIAAITDSTNPDLGRKGGTEAGGTVPLVGKGI